MGFMILCRTFYAAPEQGQDLTGDRDLTYIPIFQVLKLFQVVCFNGISMAIRCEVLNLDTV